MNFSEILLIALLLEIITSYSCLSDEFQNYFVNFCNFSSELSIDIFITAVKKPIWMSEAGLAGDRILGAEARQRHMRSHSIAREQGKKEA